MSIVSSAFRITERQVSPCPLRISGNRLSSPSLLISLGQIVHSIEVVLLEAEAEEIAGRLGMHCAAVGVDYAGEASQWPLRFFDRDSGARIA